MADLDDLRERLALSLVGTLGPALRARAGERVYVAALTTDSDLVTVDLALHTEEALAHLTADSPQDHLAHYRWWPDEWAGTTDDLEPDGGAESLVALSRALWDASDEAPDHDAWRRSAHAVLEGALGDARVRAVLAGHAPVLFVADTDGGPERTAASVATLNAAHPDPALVAAARTYFLS